ncbi:MAG: cation:proton antiporter, partial [Candidatus Obscuribacterales bacterium]|nr:cation:proton antiporter [Candidatus Obscuribacterales bacterium]
ILGATKVVPPILAKAAKSDSREIFLLTILVLCLGIALLSQASGLSIALGAFLAGIMISESVYAHQALHDVSPLKDVFSIIFFVSVGMLLDPAFIVQHLSEVLLFVLFLILGKAAIGTLAATFAINNLRSAILVGVALSQIGEFSFVLLTIGHGLKLITDDMYNLFFAGSVLTMMATPALMTLVPALLLRLMKEPEALAQESKVKARTALKDHVIVCGYGRIGRNLGLVLESHKIPFLVIELNAGIIEDLALRGVPHLYGDAMNPIVMAKANIEGARSIVLTMPDPLSAGAVAAYVREKNAGIKIIARAHRSDDIRVFRAAGVNAVVQPEFEASIEITRMVLLSLKRPGPEIKHALEQIRTHRYAIFQPDITQPDEPEIFDALGSNMMGIWFKLLAGSALEKSIAQLNIRQRTGATITAVKREQETFAFPEPTMQLKAGDEIYAVGDFEQLQQFEEAFGLDRFSA